MEEDALLEDTSDLPHFGDEESLRGARPVVPLAEIRGSKTRSALLLAAALVCALCFGAGVALITVSINRSRRVHVQTPTTPKPINDAKSEDPSVAAAADEEEMMDLSPTEDSNSEAQTSNSKAQPSSKKQQPSSNNTQLSSNNTQPSINNTPPASIQAQPDKKTHRRQVSQTETVAESRSTPSTSENENEAPKRPILVDQWEEKRSRRVSQERTSENVRHRDLFRIRDIFEGVRH